jgi:hypothetical protein
MSDVVVDAVRKELRRRTGYNSDPAELLHVLREGVVRGEVGCG